MSARALLRAVAALVVLLVLWGAFTLFRGSISDAVTRLQLPALAPGDVDRFEIVAPGDTLRFVRNVDRWMVNDVAADPEQVRQLFGALHDSAVTSELVARTPGSHARLGVDSTGRRVVLWQGDAVLLDLIVGSPGAGFQTVYARHAAADEVFMARGVLGALARRPVDSWRDRRIAAIAADRIERLILVHGGVETVLARVPADGGGPEQAGDWTVGGVPADTAALRRLLGALADITAIGFALPAEADSLDFRRPDRRLAVLGWSADTLLDLAVDSTEAGYWVRAAGRPGVFRLDFWRVNELTPAADVLRGAGR